MKIITGAVLLLSLVLGFITSPAAANETTLDEKLAPYQAVIDQVNAEYNTTIYIPEENKGKVYGNIKDMSLDQVGQLLRKSLEVTDETVNDMQADTSYIKDSCIFQKDDSGNPTNYYLNNQDYTYDSAAKNGSGSYYIPNTFGSGKFIFLD